MPTNNRNINPVAWVDNVRKLSHRRTAAFGEVFAPVVPLGYIPPFQLVRAQGEPGLFSFTLHNMEDGTAVDVTADMVATGFQEKNFGEYVIWEYAATLPLLISVKEGRHYMTATLNDGSFLYREIFCWKPEAAMWNFVKMEWFHLQRFGLDFGHVNFEAPFKFWHWFQTELGKPSYEYERSVEARDGYEFRLKTTSWKQHLFATAGSEGLADALSYVPHMDCVNVYYLGDVLPINKTVVVSEWRERGDIANIDIELRSNTIVNTYGETLDEKDYTPERCLFADFEVVAVVEENSDFHLNGYTNASGNFAPGAYVLVTSETDGKNRLYQWVGAGGVYSAEIVAYQRAAAFVKETGEYLIYTGFNKWSPPWIVAVTTSPFTISGFTFISSLIDLWGKDVNGNETLITTITDAEFLAGVTFEAGDNIAFQVRATTYLCRGFAVSAWSAIGGIGAMQIESTFRVSGPATPEELGG